MPDGFDNTWGIVRESSVSSAPFSFLRRLLLLILIYIYIFLVVSNPGPSKDYRRVGELH